MTENIICTTWENQEMHRARLLRPDITLCPYCEIARLRLALSRIECQLKGYAEFSPADELHRIAKEAIGI